MFGVGNGGSCYDGPPIWPERPLRLKVSPEALRAAGWQPDGLVIFAVGSYHVDSDGLIDELVLMHQSGPAKVVSGNGAADGPR